MSRVGGYLLALAFCTAVFGQGGAPQAASPKIEDPYWQKREWFKFKGLNDLVKDHGLLNLPLAHVEELERELETHIQPVFNAATKKNVSARVLLLDSEIVTGGITHGPVHGAVTLFLTRGLLRLMKTPDHVKAFAGHEIFHYLVGNHSDPNESELARKIKMQREEYKADGMGMVYALEAGGSPLAMVDLLEEFARLDGLPNGVAFAKSHPISAARVSRASAKAEELADLREFPPIGPALTKIPELLAMTPSPLPPTNSLNRIRVDMANEPLAHNDHPSSAYELLGQFLGNSAYGEKPDGMGNVPWFADVYLFQHPNVVRHPRLSISKNAPKTWKDFGITDRGGRSALSPELFVDFLTLELARIRSRLTPATLDGIPNLGHVFEESYPIPDGTRGVQHRFHRLWAWLPDTVRQIPQVQDLFIKESRILDEKLREMGSSEDGVDARTMAFVKNALVATDAKQLLAAASHLPFKAEEIKVLRRSNWEVEGVSVALGAIERSHPSPSLTANPDLALQALEKYIQHLPQLASHLPSVELLSLRNQVLSLIGSVLNHPHPDVRERVAARVAELDKQVDRTVPGRARFLLLPPMIQTFDNDLPDHEIARVVEANEKYTAEQVNKHFQVPRTAWAFDFSSDRAYRGKPLFASSFDWIHDPKSQFSSAREFVEFVTATDRAWLDPLYLRTDGGIHHVSSFSSRLHGEKERLHDNFYGARIPIDGYFPWIDRSLQDFTLTTEEVRQILSTDSLWRQGRPQTQHDVTGTIYDQSPYRVPPREVEKLQLHLFVALQDNGVPPLDEEAALWKQFADRAVTPFTDRWAEDLQERIPRDSESGRALLELMLKSQRVWDLSLRKKIAEGVWSDPEHLLNKNPTFFWDHLKRFFPEMSSERLSIADRFAERHRFDRAATVTLMESLGQVGNGNKATKITMAEGLGERIYTALLESVVVMKTPMQIEFLDFMLGKSKEPPAVFTDSRESFGRHFTVKDERSSFLMGPSEMDRHFELFRFIREHVGPHRLQRIFVAQPPKAVAVLIDPLLVGAEGLVKKPEGRAWIQRTLIPRDVSWGQLATDLVDGYVDGLIKLGQGHLKTLFVSYLIASSKGGSKDEYDVLFPPRSSETKSDETQTGRTLRILGQTNSAMAKLAQRLHSSGLLAPEDNRSLHRVKEDVEEIYRSVVFDWIEAAECVEGGCNRIQLEDRKGNASVKVVAGAKLNGKAMTLYLVKPNAERRADTQFQLLEHAMSYAIAKGHDSLKLMLPVLRRTRARFAEEIDMKKERSRMKQFAKLYAPDKQYEGVHFITPEVLGDLDKVLKDQKAMAVKGIQVKRFSDLSGDDRVQFAKAVALKERELAQVRQGKRQSYFNVDAHEGNFLLIDDPKYLEARGLKGKYILAIDAGMLGRATSAQVGSVVDVMTQLTLAKWMPDVRPDALKVLQRTMKTWFGKDAPPATTVEKAMLAAAEATTDPLSAVSRYISELEAAGHVTPDSIVDYKDSLLTKMTWDQHTDGAFSKGFIQDAMSRVRKHFVGKPYEGCLGMLEMLMK